MVFLGQYSGHPYNKLSFHKETWLLFLVKKKKRPDTHMLLLLLLLLSRFSRVRLCATP